MRLGAALLLLFSPASQALAAPKSFTSLGFGLVPAPLSLPSAGLAVPAPGPAALALGAPPALPASALPAASPLSFSYAPKLGLTPLAAPPAAFGLPAPVGEVLSALYAVPGLSLLPPAEAGAPPELVAARFAEAFDRSGRRGGGPADADGGTIPGALRLPSGVTRVSIGFVRWEGDVDRLIPSNPNSTELIKDLKAAVDAMAPYRVFTYHDAKGGSFAGIDLSSRPDLIGMLPGQESHEVRLIKKIQLWTQDLQVLVREAGKTPDLVVGGMVTELKSLIGDRVDLTYLLNKANLQVLEHAERHGLGVGAVAVDLTKEDRVPVSKVLAELNGWQRLPLGSEIGGDYDGPRLAKKQVVLSKVYVFAGNDLKVFTRRPNGSYALLPAAEIPFAPAHFVGPVEPRQVHELQLQIARGRSKEARSGLRALEDVSLTAEPASQVRQLRRYLEGRRFLERARSWLRRGQRERAMRGWREFARNHGRETADKVKAEFRALLEGSGRRGGPPAKAGAAPADVLARHGVRATVVVRGSARVVPHGQAHSDYIAAFARLGFNGVRSPEGRREMERAQTALRDSLVYEEARSFGALAGREGRGEVAVVTAAEGGVMEAAAIGALSVGRLSAAHRLGRAGGTSSPTLFFRHRDAASLRRGLHARAAAFVYFPGGFDTAEDLFETLRLMKRGVVPRAPVILVGPREQWELALGLQDLASRGLLSPSELSLLRFAESAGEAWAMVSAALPAPTPAQ